MNQEMERCIAECYDRADELCGLLDMMGRYVICDSDKEIARLTLLVKRLAEGVRESVSNVMDASLRADKAS